VTVLLPGSFYLSQWASRVGVKKKGRRDELILEHEEDRINECRAAFSDVEEMEIAERVRITGFVVVGYRR
jgi:hypothetical protein